MPELTHVHHPMNLTFAWVKWVVIIMKIVIDSRRNSGAFFVVASFEIKLNSNNNFHFNFNANEIIAGQMVKIRYCKRRPSAGCLPGASACGSQTEMGIK